MTVAATETRTIDERLASIEEAVTEVRAFCMHLAEVLESIGSNPMLQAMIPGFPPPSSQD